MWLVLIFLVNGTKHKCIATNYIYFYCLCYIIVYVMQDIHSYIHINKKYSTIISGIYVRLNIGWWVVPTLYDDFRAGGLPGDVYFCS